MLYFTSILLTGVLAGFLTWYAWRQHNVPGGRAFAGLGLCICLLALSESLSMLSPSPARALFWFNVRIIFTATIPVLFLVFALEYSGHKDWLSRRLLALAFIFPVLTQVILWSNSLHGWWVKQEVAFHQSGSFWLAQTSARIPGLWFMIHSFYCLILLLAGIVVILVTAWNRRGLYRAQGLLLSAGALVALVTTLIPVFNLIPQAEFNPFTPGLGLGLLLTALAVFRFWSPKRLPAAQTGSRTRTLEMQSGHSQAVFFLIFFVMAASIAGVAYLSYQNYGHQFRQRAEDQLSTIANLKVSELENWRAERMSDAQAMQTPAFAALAARSIENPPDTQAQAQMQTWLDSLRRLYNYDRVFLLDTAGLERISSPAAPEPVEAHLTQEETAVLSAGQVIFLDFHRDTEDGPIYLALLVPIYLEQNSHPLGLLVLRIDPNVYLYPYIQQWPVPSASSETLLVRREGADVLFLNELRFQAGTALTLRLSLENAQLPAVKAVLGQEGIVEGVDYRGVPVLAATRRVQDSPWFLVAKMDTAEVYAPLWERLWQTLVLSGALLAASGGGVMLAWRQQRLRYYRGQVEAAEALQQLSMHQQALLSAIPDIIMEVDHNKVYTWANQAGIEFFGEDVVGKEAVFYFLGEQNTYDVVQPIFDGNENVIYVESWQRRKDGEKRLLAWWCRVLKDDSGNATGALSSAHDITESKQTEEKLQEERILLRTLIDNIPDYINVMDVHGRKILSNSADWQVSGGKTMEDVIGKTDRDLLPPELAEPYWALDRMVIDSGTSIINREEPGPDSQGNPVQLLTTKVPLRDGQGKVVGLVSISRDITERKQAEAQILAVQAELQQMLTEADQSRRTLLSILEDQQRAGSALRDSEEKLSSVIRQTGVGIVVFQKGEQVFHNARIYEMLGYTQEEYAGLDFISRVHPKDRSFAVDLFQQGPAGAESNLTQMRLLAKSGEIRWIETSSTSVQWEGQPAVQAFILDITERQQWERVREALYAISQTAVTAESLDDLYLSIHRALDRLMVAENFYIALYDPDEDLISFPYYVDQQRDGPTPPRKPRRGLTEYILRTGRPLLADPQTFAQLVQQGEVELIGAAPLDWLGMPLKVGAQVFGVIAVQSYAESARYSYVEVEMLEFVSNQVALVIANKLAQQRIIDALEFNRTLTDVSTLGIAVYDSSGQCILANEAIARIIGATRAQVLQQNYNSIEPFKKTGLFESAREAVASGHSTRGELHTMSTFGKEVWLDCRFTPFVSNGEPHLLLTIDDIFSSKRAEVALQAYAAKLEQSNRDLQEFAYVASHDLQEPLRKVLAFGDLLTNKYGDALGETGIDYLKRMQDASQRMQTLIYDLLSFSRVSTRTQPFTEVDLNTVAQEVVSDLENQIERTHARVETGNLPTIQVDPTQMRQLLQNLIGNALKFHSKENQPLIQVSAQIQGKECQISVQDNGIGFDTRYLDRIFKPFERLHSREEYEGSGMGLAICRRIVERHGGSITAASTPGEGSTFIVTLPIHQPRGDK